MRNPFKREEKLPEFAPSTDPEARILAKSSTMIIREAREAEVARALRVASGWDIRSVAEYRRKLRTAADARDPLGPFAHSKQARQSYIRQSSVGKEQQNE